MLSKNAKILTRKTKSNKETDNIRWIEKQLLVRKIIHRGKQRQQKDRIKKILNDKSKMFSYFVRKIAPKKSVDEHDVDPNGK